MRSPNYPALGLSQAIDAAKILYDKEHQSDVPPDVAAKHWGYKSLSGPARTKVAALKHYGLLEDGRHGVKISPLALRILMPTDEGERKEAIHEAAITPPLFNELLDKLPDASDEALTAYLVRQRKFGQDGARICIKAYRDTISLAGLPAEGYTPKDNPQEGEPMTTTLNPSPTAGAPTRVASSGPASETLRVMLAPDLSAEVRFTGTRAQLIEPLYLQLLSEQLEFMRKQMERLKKESPTEPVSSE